MSWFATREGYEVYFNRDERRSRLPADPPAVRQRGRTRYISPRDGDFGGSWLMVNERGMTLALENGYSDLDDVGHEPEDGFTSRGLLLPELIELDSPDGVMEHLARRDLHRFRAFLLVALDDRGQGRLARWTRGKLDVEARLEEQMPLISSSFETTEVRRSRRECFERLRAMANADPVELHLAYHESHWPRRGPLSPCMHRPEARTVSFSRIEVDPREIRFHYVAHPPCRGRPTGEPVRLARSRGVALAHDVD